VVNISSAVDDIFRPDQLAPEQRRAALTPLGLSRPFIMYTGGIDYRKNIEGLIEAFAMLPGALRRQYQLAVVCGIQDTDRFRLRRLAARLRLAEDELVLTGYVSDADLVTLYNSTALFVFPSLHEGFGLPALEAMACGAPVIGSNCSSIPEVIGRADALFDPRSDASIAAKLEQVLTDDAFRAELERYGPEQAMKFSWDASAVRALRAIEAYVEAHPAQPQPQPRVRPTLAYVSPLPPERSGISDYSAELLPELARHYEIDVIAPQERVSDPWIKANCTLRGIDWFRDNAERYDRVLYHFGNSHFHQHMFGLIEEVPGMVVLHDFFLSGIASHMELTGQEPGHWARSLYDSHGYDAVRARFHTADIAEVIWRYPANLAVLRHALGLIVHSDNSKRLAREWYQAPEADSWAVIPHLRVPETGMSKAEARLALGLREDAFVVCSFGLMGPTKLNQRLLDAWLASGLARDERCVLVFVGENQQGEYGATLAKTIKRSGMTERIRITGWADMAVFRQYLGAADAGVQLRTLSRGETSGTVLDCMNYGLATIVNANGSMADLPEEGVIKLADVFADADLVSAMETLWRDNAARAALGARARDIIRTVNAPRCCADMYAQAIEAVYAHADCEAPALTRRLAAVEPEQADDMEWMALAQALAASIAPRFARRQLLVDVSRLLDETKGDAIRLGSYGSLGALLAAPPQGMRVEPVYAVADQGYCYARQFSLRLMGCTDDALPDEPAEFRAGDLMLVPADGQAAEAPTLYEALGNLGVQIQRVR
jgi:glycosyltransferase involved in cell wall biosynthesis